MSKLSIDQKTVLELLSDRKRSFLIPDYQRPYAWTEEQCQTLWDDIFQFAFPDNNKDKFNEETDEYFLGSIVTFKNQSGKLEVIDGQQRLTTLLLFLRAFYDKFELMTDNNTIKTKTIIEKCIWKADTYDTIDKDILKIESEVAMDDDKEEFISILKTGIVSDSQKSNYAVNYRFFRKKIAELKENTDGLLADFAIRTVRNCILLPIEADNEDSALRIFSTLNNRGLPLADADIFKHHFYLFYSKIGKKDYFMKIWKDLEFNAEKTLKPQQGTPMDELFTLYMYYLRAQKGITDTTTQALRDFYETGGDKKGNTKDYSFFQTPKTLNDLQSLIAFWQKIKNQDRKYFSENVLKRLFVLDSAPNKMWSYILSVYFIANKDENDNLDNIELEKFLKKVTLLTLSYAVINPGVNQLRGPIFKEMKSIVEGRPSNFEETKINESSLELFNSFDFWNGRPITKSILMWYAFENPEQELLSLSEQLNIEHIYAKKRGEINSHDANLIESIGNKIMLEKSINSRASDYRFEDKKDFYTGNKSRSDTARPTKIKEFSEIVKLNKFEEEEIINRKSKIFEKLFQSLKNEGML